MASIDDANYAKYASTLANLKVDENAVADIKKATSSSSLTAAERAAMTTEEKIALVKSERETRMLEAMQERVASDPMLDPSVRPEAPAPSNNMLYYYSWIGGATSGQWELYRAPQTPENIAKYGARAFGGETQQEGISSLGANALKNQPQLVKDANGNIIGYELDGRTISTGAVGSSAGGSTGGNGNNTGFTTVNGTLYFNGSPYSGEYQGKDWVNGKATGTSTTVKTSSQGGGLSQADVDASIAAALAAQQAKFDALIAQQKAEADAAKLALKVKASDKLKTMLAGYGLEGLAGFIDRRIMADVSEEQVMLELYDQPEYQQRFPGMASLRKKGRTISEKEYMDNENAMVQTARFFDLPKGFYDSADDFGKLIGNEVSPKEYQDRLQVGQDLARGLNPAIKTELINLFGVGEGDITAYVLDADRALPLIQKQAKAAQFVGLGRQAGFKLGGITATQAENIAGTESYAKLSQAELAKALGAAGQLRSTQQRLANLEGVAYNEQEALNAVIEGSPEALLASQQRAQREAARFSTRGGITGSSLRSTTQF